MASGIKCDPGIPDVWRLFKTDSKKPPRNPEWSTPLCIKGEELVQFNKMDQTSDEFKDLHDKLPWCSYLIFYIYEKKEIRVEKVGDFEDTTADRKTAAANLKSKLEKEKPRYIIYKYRFTLPDGRAQNKLFGLFWCPQEVLIGPKMIYASSKSELEKKLEGIKTFKQADVTDEVDYELGEFEKEK